MLPSNEIIGQISDKIMSNEFSPFQNWYLGEFYMVCLMFGLLGFFSGFFFLTLYFN